MNIIKYNSAFLEYRDTPWDKKVFNIDTKEILNIYYSSEDDINFLLLELENSFNNEGLIYFRRNSSDNLTKKFLINKNYFIAETSLKLTLNKIQKQDFSRNFKSNLVLNINNISKENLLQIKEIAKTSFNYSRFHEDPFIDTKLSNLRYENWIDDLIKQNKNIITYQNSENEILSFMFYSCIDNKVDLILGGSKKDFGLLTPSFFASIMKFFQTQNIKKIDVIISASNIVIFNIYINLFFTVKETMFDYHKFIIKKEI